MEQYIAEITNIVKNADESFKKSGGSSRHWVRDNFFPELKAGGFTIAKIEPPRPQHGTPEDIWEGFWKDIVTNPDGSINIEQLKKELYDFSYVMEQVPKVYCHITGDSLSKIMYPAETVIRVADDYTSEIVEREIADRQVGLRWVKGEYERLYQQVKSGKRSVCYIDYQFSDEIIARDICTIKPRIDGDELDLSIRGLSYGSTWDPAYQGSTHCDKFVNMCTHFNVEWLDESAS